MPTIRPAIPADASAVVTLRETVFPYLVRGVSATNRMIASPPPEESRAAFVAVDGRVLAFTLLVRNGTRLWSDMTATVPEFRGMGLAGLIKRTALRRAAEDGATVAYTANAEANKPMLAINERLGYRPLATNIGCVTILEG